MNTEESIERIKRKITIGECEKNIGIPVYISDLKAVLEELKKKENMYIKEYNEHMEKKRQNGVLINNEQILKRELEKKDKVINLMAKELYVEGYCKNINCKKCNANKFWDCIKEYFTNKVG